MKLYTTLFSKAILACTALMCLLSTTSMAQNAGIYDDYIILDTTAYFVGGSYSSIPNAPQFTGQHLGYFQIGDTLNISGADQYVYKINSSGNICSGHLHYAVYPVGSSSSSFTSVGLGFGANYNFATSTNQLWTTTNNTANILSGLTAGQYVINVYFSATGSLVSNSTCEDTLYANNGGPNYLATFTVGATPFDTTYTSAAVFGPFCYGPADSIVVPFTTSGGLSGTYYVQLSDSSGAFPANDTSNIISAGDTSGRLTAVLPDSLPAAGGYRVRVVQQNPYYINSGDNGNNIIIRPNVTSSLVIEANHASICAGQPVTFTADSIVNGGVSPVITFYVNGDSVGTGGTYSQTFSTSEPVYAVLTSSAQCVSPATAQSPSVSVTVYPNPSTASYDTICAGDSVMINGIYRSATGAYGDTLSAAHGCDSINTVYLTILAAPRHSIYDTICMGTSYTFNGRSLNASGTYSDTLTNSHGCDSIVSLGLTVTNSAPTNINATVCQGSSYLFGGRSLTTSGNYIDTLTSSHGCDSVIMLNLTTLNITTTNVNISICNGTTYSFNGRTLSSSGNYVDTMTSSHGCDSIIQLDLTIKNVSRDTLHASFCPGSTYSYNGMSLAAPGTYSDTVRCDSISTLVLAMYPLPVPVITVHPASPYDTLSTGQFSSYLWLLNLLPVANDTSESYLPTAPGYYVVVVTDANGCRDTAGVSVINTGINNISTLNINVYPNPAKNILYIATPANSDIATMTIADEMGRTVYTMSADQSAALMQIDISTYANGIYVLSVKDKNNQSAYRQIVIAR